MAWTLARSLGVTRIIARVTSRPMNAISAETSIARERPAVWTRHRTGRTRSHDPAVVETEFGKALGGGLYEFRLRWSAAEVQRKVEGVSAQTAAKAEKIMLRVFFCTSGRKIILLLSGYDKARDPGDTRQGREITRARKLLTAHEEAKRRRER
jgi:hypothetical protein